MSKNILLVIFAVLVLSTAVILFCVNGARQSDLQSSSTLPSSTAPHQVKIIGSVSIAGKPQKQVRVYLLPKMVSAAEFEAARDELVANMQNYLRQMTKAADTVSPSLAEQWRARLKEGENKLNTIKQPVKVEPGGLVSIEDAYEQLHFRANFGSIFSKEVISESLTSNDGSFVLESTQRGEYFVTADVGAEAVRHSWLVPVPSSKNQVNIDLSETNSIIAWEKH